MLKNKKPVAQQCIVSNKYDSIKLFDHEESGRLSEDWIELEAQNLKNKLDDDLEYAWATIWAAKRKDRCTVDGFYVIVYDDECYLYSFTELQLALDLINELKNMVNKDV